VAAARAIDLVGGCAEAAREAIARQRQHVAYAAHADAPQRFHHLVRALEQADRQRGQLGVDVSALPHRVRMICLRNIGPCAFFDRDGPPSTRQQTRRRRSRRGGNDRRKSDGGEAGVDAPEQRAQATEIIKAAGNLQQHIGRRLDGDGRRPLAGPERDVFQRGGFCAFVAQVNRNLGDEPQRRGDAHPRDDAALLRRIVGDQYIGTMTRRADHRGDLAHLGAREDAQREVVKMQAGPEHGGSDPSLISSFPRKPPNPSFPRKRESSVLRTNATGSPLSRGRR
jgi:hypothetical protein